MTTIPVSETLPSHMPSHKPGHTGAPHAAELLPTSTPRVRDPLAGLRTRLSRVEDALRSLRGVLLALLTLGRLHAQTAWAEVRATTPAWFPVVLVAWCGVAAVLATAFGIWVLVSILITG